MKMRRMLFQKCWSCDGTRKTTQAFNEGRPGHLAAGSECPLCEDGYWETGLTMGQAEEVILDRCRLLLFVAGIAEHAIDREEKARATELLRGRAGEVEEARRKLAASR